MNLILSNEVGACELSVGHLLQSGPAFFIAFRRGDAKCGRRTVPVVPDAETEPITSSSVWPCMQRLASDGQVDNCGERALMCFDQVMHRGVPCALTLALQAPATSRHRRSNEARVSSGCPRVKGRARRPLAHRSNG